MALDICSIVVAEIQTRIHIGKGIATCRAAVEGTVQQGAADTIRPIANSLEDVVFSTKIVKIV